jgi:hypothetical protein
MAIPNHFQNTSLDIFQIMPDHVHGIVNIRENPNPVGSVRPRHAVTQNGPTICEIPQPSVGKGDEMSPLPKT